MIRGSLLLVAVSCSADPAIIDSQTTVEPSAVAAPAPRPDAAALSGDRPLAAGSLESWMSATMAPTFKRRDFATLDAEFKELAGLGPRGWNGWTELAEAGSAAAREGSVEKVRVVCVGCHARFRGRFRTELGARTLTDSRGE